MSTCVSCILKIRCFPYRKITYVGFYNIFFDTKNDLTANTTVLYNKNMMIKSYVDWFLLKKSIIFFKYRYEHKLIRCGMTRRFRKYKKVDFENLWVTTLLHTTRDIRVYISSLCHVCEGEITAV